MRGIVVETLMSMKAMRINVVRIEGLGRLAGQAVNLGLQKNTEQLGIDLFVAHAELQNIEGAIRGNGALIRTVRSGQGVVNVADGHHLGLDGNLIRIQTERITLAVEFFMMRAGNFRDPVEFFGPRNLRQKIEAV